MLWESPTDTRTDSFVFVTLLDWAIGVAYRFLVLSLQLLGFILLSHFISSGFNTRSITIPNNDE
jgi:hypothetical protein